MLQKFLSIITINFNNSEGLRKTIDSIQSQTSKNYEHIIIDGGSTDGSVEVIKESLKDSDYSSQVSFWCSEKDNGLYDAMNKGVEYVNGKYCLFLNSGDYLADNTVIERFDKYELSDAIIYTNAYFFNSKKKWKVTYPSKLTFNYFYGRHTLCHQNMLFSAEFIKKNHYSLDYKYASDVDLYMKAFCLDNIDLTYVDDVISCYENEFGLTSCTETEEEKNEEWNLLIEKCFSNKKLRDALEESLKIKKELDVYEYCYHGILKKIKSLFLFYSKIKNSKTNR